MKIILLKKIMQITNVHKRFTAFPTMIRHEKHTIDSRAKISENSNDLLCSLVKSLKIKFLHPTRRSWQCYHSKCETSKSWKISSNSYHEHFFRRQHSEAAARRCFIKKLSLIISKNSQEQTRTPESFFNKVASWTLLKDSGTRVFL